MEHIRFLIVLAGMFIVGIGFIYAYSRHVARQKKEDLAFLIGELKLINAIKARKQAIKESK